MSEFNITKEALDRCREKDMGLIEARQQVMRDQLRQTMKRMDGRDCEGLPRTDLEEVKRAIRMLAELMGVEP